MHEYKFDKIEVDENIGGNNKQIKTQDEAVKYPEILHIPTQRVRVNPKVEIIPNTSKTREGIKFRSGKQLYELPNKMMTGDTNTITIHIDNLNHIQNGGEIKY